MASADSIRAERRRQPRRPVPRPSRRVVRGPNRRLDPRRCADVRANHGRQAQARRGTRRPCAGRLPRRRRGHARACRGHAEHGRVPQHRSRDPRPMDRWAAMRIVRNTGTDRVIDIVRPWLRAGNRSRPCFGGTLSLFRVWRTRRKSGADSPSVRLVLPPDEYRPRSSGIRCGPRRPQSSAGPLARRPFRGHGLRTRPRCAERAERFPQGAMVLRNGDGRAETRPCWVHFRSAPTGSASRRAIRST